MPLPHIKRWILALALVVVCLVGFFAFTLLLPYYLETRLLPRWAAEVGFDPQTIRLRRIGWRGTDTGPIRLNMGDLSFGEVAAIQIDYSPASLLLRRIDGIVLSGLNLSLTLNDAGTAIAGWAPPAQDAAAKSPAIPVADLPQRVPVGLKRLAVRNAMVTVHWRGRTVEIPLEMDLDTRRLDQGRLQVTARLSPRGNPIHLAGEVQTGANTMALTVTAKELELARFSDMLALLTDLPPMVGQMDLKTQTLCRLSPWAVTSSSGEARFANTGLVLADGTIDHRATSEGEPLPIVMQWKSDDGRTFFWSLGPWRYRGPATLHVDGMEGRLTLEEQGWHADTTVRAVLPAQSLAPGGPAPLAVIQPLTMDLSLAAQGGPARAIQWELHTLAAGNGTGDGICLQRGDWRVESQAPRMEAAGRIGAGAINGRFEVAIRELCARQPLTTLYLPDFTLGGEFQATPDPQVQVTAELSGLHCTLGEAAVELPQTRLEGRLRKDATKDWAFVGELALADGRVLYTPQAAQLRQIGVRLPVHYPVPPQAPVGEVTVGQMLWQSRSLGGWHGKIGLGPAGLWSDLRHASKLFPGLSAQMRAEVGRDEASMVLTVPDYAPAEPVDLGRTAPAAKGFLFQGRIEAHAEARTQGTAVQSRGRVRINQGVLRQPARGLTLEGLACDLRLEDLIALRSEPRQQLRVAGLTLGKLAVQQVNIDFQLEPNATLFIEKAGLQWCKGTMQTQAFRLTPGRNEVDVTVYCDRLNLAMMLEQLGVAQGNGEGAVNGRIPVRWRDGEPIFDNGFLYSTPGQTGTIRLSGTQTLLEGLAPGTPQHTQLDIASEALKDYSYNWAKVDLRSQGDLLLVNLKLDGKPNRLLPFAYDPQSGAFKRFSGQGQAEFQGVNIDLNFKTPLREILHYRQLMDTK